MGCDIHAFVESSVGLGPKLDVGRSYELFAALAGVRQDSGFEHIEPLAEHRGVPREYETRVYDFGDHSFSYCTFAEFLGYPWRQTTHQSGIVPAKALRHWNKKWGSPYSWNQGVWGPNVVILEEDELRKLLKEHTDEELKDHYARCKWDAILIDRCGHAWAQIASALMEAEGPPADVRLIFGFDS